MKRWIAGFLLAIVMLAAGYFGSALLALDRIAGAVREARYDLVVKRTDILRLRQSIVEQLQKAYAARYKQPQTARDRIVKAYGESIVEAKLKALLTPENIATLFRSGELSGDGTSLRAPPLSALRGPGFDLVSRLSIHKPLELQISLAGEEATSHGAALRVHLGSDGWKISGIVIPPAVLEGMFGLLS
jgi:hypothetical protein